MPIIESAKKALRNSAKKRVFNIQRRNEMNTLVKSVRKLIANKKTKDAEALLPKVYQAIDKAAKTNYIKQNTAARTKSRIMAALKKVA